MLLCQIFWLAQSEGQATQTQPIHQICQFFGRFGGLAGPMYLGPRFVQARIFGKVAFFYYFYDIL